jgi:hypothetical protein
MVKDLNCISQAFLSLFSSFTEFGSFSCHQQACALQTG